MAKKVSDEVKSRVTSLVTKKLLDALRAKVGFLAVGPVGWLAGIVINKVIEKALELTFLGFLAARIYVRTEADLHKVEKVLKEVDNHEGDMTEDEIVEYDKRLAEAGRNLIRFGSP